MKAIRLFSSVYFYLVSRHLSFCAGMMRIVKLTVDTRKLKVCQHCLLLASAPRVEAKLGSKNETTPGYELDNIFYWVWRSDFFLTNLIACSIISSCGWLTYESPLDMDTSRINEEMTKTNQSIKPTKHRLDFGRHSTAQVEESACSDYAENSGDCAQQRHSRVCLHVNALHITTGCEACIQKHSDVGDMEKYYLYHNSHMSLMYVVYTSASGNIQHSCGKTEICKGTTAEASEILCNSFNSKILSGNTHLQMAENSQTEVSPIEISYQVWSRKGVKESKTPITLFQTFMLKSACVKTSDLYKHSKSCLTCLTKEDGLVVLDRDERFIPPFKAVQSPYYRMVLFSKDPNSSPKCEECGTLGKSTRCMLDGTHVSRPFAAKHNYELMEPKLHAQSKHEDLIDVTTCTMAKFKVTNYVKCQRCLQKFGKILKLSPVTVLVSLPIIPYKDSLVSLRRCTFMRSCIELTFMPDFMCQYESRLAELNLNMPAMEGTHNLPNSDPTPSASTTSGLDSAEVLGIVRWEANNAEECLRYLTLIRKVVLISLINGYVWIVKSTESVPIPRFCTELYIADRTYIYHRILRQIPLKDLDEYGFEKGMSGHEANQPEPKKHKKNGAH